MLYCLQLHLISLGSFARWYVWAIEFFVHQKDYSFVIIKIADDDRHISLARTLRRFPESNSYRLLFAGGSAPSPGKQGGYAIGKLLHSTVVMDVERVIRAWMQLRQRPDRELIRRLFLFRGMRFISHKRERPIRKCAYINGNWILS